LGRVSLTCPECFWAKAQPQVNASTNNDINFVCFFTSSYPFLFVIRILDYAVMENETETADLLRKHGGKTGEELKGAGN
jgi:hypothetical protein